MQGTCAIISSVPVTTEIGYYYFSELECKQVRASRFLLATKCNSVYLRDESVVGKQFTGIYMYTYIHM